MKDGKYSVMIVEDQQMPKALFSHFVESSDKFHLEAAIENASVADVVCTRTPIDLILMDGVTEIGAKIRGDLTLTAKWEKKIEKEFFLFRLEVDKADENDSNAKIVEFYSTRVSDGKRRSP